MNLWGPPATRRPVSPISAAAARRAARCAAPSAVRPYAIRTSRSSLPRRCRCRTGLEVVQPLRLLRIQQADSNEVEWADEAVGDSEPTRARDRVSKRHGPVVFDQDECRGRVRLDVLQDVPLVASEDVDAVGSSLCAGVGALLGPLLACDAEADERPDLRAELDRLLLAEVAQVLDLELPLRILVHRERVDHTHGVALA